MIYGTSSASFRATVHRTPNHSDFGSWHRWTGYRSIQRLAAAFRCIGAGRSARLCSRRIASSIAWIMHRRLSRLRVYGTQREVLRKSVRPSDKASHREAATKRTRHAETPSGRREARRVSEREIANQSAERIYLPAPFAKRNLSYLRNVKFATCV